MAGRKTQDVSLFDETSGTSASVDSAGRLSFTGYSINTNVISKYASVVSSRKFPLTILTYTVPVGTTLFITNWHLEGSNGDAVGSIKVNGVSYMTYFVPGVAGCQQYVFGDSSPLIVPAGSVITIVAEVGSSKNKQYFASFNGYEVTA